MKQKYLMLPSLLVATLVMAISVHRSTSVKYVFSQEPSPMPETSNVASIDYKLPDPGITPDSVLWPVMAIADSTETSASALLQSADFRLAAGHAMVANGKAADGVAVLEKAEMYLQKSFDATKNISNDEEMHGALMQITQASLKHRQVLETILLTVPEDGRAIVARTLNTPKTIYEESAGIARKAGLNPPSNPF